MALVQVYNPVAALSISPRIEPLASRLMTDVAELLSLQDTDVALDRALSRLAEIEAGLGESEELVAARETAAEKAGADHEIRSARRGRCQYSCGPTQRLRNLASQFGKVSVEPQVRRPRIAKRDVELANQPAWPG